MSNMTHDQMSREMQKRILTALQRSIKTQGGFLTKNELVAESNLMPLYVVNTLGELSLNGFVSFRKSIKKYYITNRGINYIKVLKDINNTEKAQNGTH